MPLMKRPGPRTATRLGFVVAGFVSGCWSPLVPFAKARLGVDDARLGLVLLAFGVGSLIGVGAAGVLTTRMGSRPLVILGGGGMCIVLPMLAIAGSPWTLGAALLVFGASLGALDVAVNAHGVEVESAAAKALMSGFHALFSLGSFAGAAWMTLFLRAGSPPLAATALAAAIGLGLIAVAGTGLLSTRPADRSGPLLVVPTGLVAVIALLTAAAFLTEGAVFDWSALLSIDRRIATPAEAGVGFILFSLAMTGGRLAGDALVRGLGPRMVVQAGGSLAVLGVVAVLVCPIPALALGGFLLLGLGAANVVPVLFSAAGRQTTMPPALAVAAVTSTGYAGILAGPPLLGFVARAVGLPNAFWILACLLMLVPLLAGAATRPAR